jgi:hypothetical protein
MVATLAATGVCGANRGSGGKSQVVDESVRGFGDHTRFCRFHNPVSRSSVEGS